ncbi:hypothetical protein TNCV_3709181 [Trichonephila clavipes]|nr:hypothetical protein TNCV_3709181 [Trichonephila clavipes]
MFPITGSTVEAIIFNPDESGVKTNWKSAGGTNAGAQMLLRLLELMRLLKSDHASALVLLSLSLSLCSPYSRVPFKVKYVLPTKVTRDSHFCLDVFSETILLLVQVPFARCTLKPVAGVGTALAPSVG